MLTATLTLGKKMFGGSARHRENVFNLTNVDYTICQQATFF